VRWADACDEVARQLGARDELLVICDTADDPVADRRGATPEGVRIVLAGEPEGCSGKANAIAAGMEAAEHDRIAWTDDDFAHPDDWLATLDADYERQGPTTEVPVFVGRDPLARLFEPAYALGGTAAVSAGGIAWGGAVVFERGDLRDGQDAFLADLRRTVSDDGTLTEHVDVTAADRTRTVPCGGSLRGSLERFVRFFRIMRYHTPRAAAFDVAFAVAVVATREVRAPPKPYAAETDHLIVIDTGTRYARVLHVEPTVSVGDEITAGGVLGRVLRSGYFSPWVENHIHLEFREYSVDPVRATGSLDLTVDVPVRGVSWDGTGRVVSRGDAFLAIEGPSHPCPAQAFEGIGCGGGALAGGFPHHVNGAIHGRSEGQVTSLDERIGSRNGRTVTWDPFRVLVNGCVVTGVSVVKHRGAVRVRLGCEEDVPLEEGEPVTIKRRRDWHKESRGGSNWSDAARP
jgi:hypothetical protein